MVTYGDCFWGKEKPVGLWVFFLFKQAVPTKVQTKLL